MRPWWFEVEIMPPLQVVLASCALLGFSGCHSQLRPDATLLVEWNTQLRDHESDDAFAAVYAHGQHRLVFIGAAHTDEVNSLTFRLIDGAYDSLVIDEVIVEGIARSRGPNDERLLKWAGSRDRREGRQEGGELTQAVRAASAEGAVVWGGEPDDAQIRDALGAQGVPAQDLLGFYTLRTVPQWLRERKISDPEDARLPALIDAELAHNRERLNCPASLLPDYAAWSSWYARTNGKPFGAGFTPEEAGPLADGRHATNRIATLISRSRDAFLLEFIAERLNAGVSVLVVFGKSHLTILRPALDVMLGPPCHVGSDISSVAARQCGSAQSHQGH
jgi:hypothetical protein